MRIFVNILKFCYSQTFNFDNGWSVLVEDLGGNKANAFIIPTQLVELLTEGHNDKDVFKDYELKDMKARGDLFENVKSDNKLVNILGHVKNRPIEKHLASINDMIVKAGK